MLLEDRNKYSVVHRALPLYPCLEAILAGWGHCPVCLGPILNIWLECVHFVCVRKVWAPRILMRVSKHEHIPPVLHALPWLPVSSRTE